MEKNQHVYYWPNNIRSKINRLMKYLSVFLVLFTLYSFADSYAQTTKLKLDLKEATISDVIQRIEKQSEFVFIYNNLVVPELLKGIGNVKIKNKKISKVLDNILDKTKLVYIVNGRQVVLKLKEKSLEENAFVKSNEIQQREISGLITDDSGEPLPGVTVLVEGTKIGAQSNFDGRYAVKGSKGAVLVFTYVGMITKKVIVGDSNVINVKLEEDTNELEEVIVIGYGVKTKATLTGAVTSVDSKNFESKPAGNIINSLQGKIPGLLLVRGSSQIGNEGNGIEIRGETSRNSVGVLTIIDGIPQRSLGTSAIESINPEDIETFTVLKDAQAAIYGARAAGGVILITTKKGKSSKPTIRYTSNVSINTVGNFLEHTNVKQHAEMFVDAWTNDGTSPVPFLGTIADQIAASDLSNPQVIQGPFSDTPTLWTGHNEWMETMWGTSFWQNHNLSVSGRTDKVNYYTSFQYLDQGSQLQYGENSNKKISFRTKFDYEIIKDKLTIGTNISLDDQTILTPNRYGTMLSSMQSAWTSMPATTPEGNFYHFGGFTSPNGWAALGGENEDLRRNVGFQVNVNYTPIKGLKITGQYATNREFDEGKQLKRIFRFHLMDESPSAFGAQRNSVLNYYNSTTHNTANLFATYNKSIGNHNMSLMIGGAHEEDFNNGFRAWRNDLSNEDFPILNFGDAEEQYNDESGSHYAINSLFSRFSYDYAGKYILDATIRNDKSSRFADGFRSGYFPGVAVGWVVSKEDFIDGLSDHINYLKLRLSWGELGNQNNVGRFDHISRISQGSAPLFGPNGSPVQANRKYISTLADPNRSWETVEVKNIGAEFAVLNSRLSGTIDYFQKHTRDMLIGLEYPETLGINPVTVNGGELKTKGFELSLSWKDHIKDFNYSIKATLTNDTNIVTRLDDDRVVNAGYNGFLEGHSTESYYGLEFDGFFKDQADIDDYLANTATNFSGWPFKIGDAKYKDTDGDGEIEMDTPYTEAGDPDSGDLVLQDDNRRHNLFSVDLGFEYKGFDFSAFLQGVGSWNTYNSISAVGGDWWNQPFKYSYGQHQSIDAASNAKYPRLTANSGIDWYNYSIASNAPYRKVNNAYVRLKNIQLGYSLSKTVTAKLGIDKLRFYFSGVDIWESHNLPKGFDPERPFAISYTPFVRSYSFGLDLTF